MPYTFPTISVAPKTCPVEPIDDTISSKSEGGYKQTRPRNTRQLKKYSPTYLMTASDWAAVQTFDGQVGGWSIFSWTPPAGSVQQVRFASRPKAEITKINGAYLYSVQFTVETA